MLWQLQQQQQPHRHTTSDDATREACIRIKRFAMGWPR